MKEEEKIEVGVDQPHEFEADNSVDEISDIFTSSARKFASGCASLLPLFGRGRKNFNLSLFLPLNSVIKGIMKRKEAIWFNTPVDPVAMGIPNYFE